ncbi:MAG: LysR family transcriptional regulator [Gammaproteobacteria bacterium]|jgi:DNA-binding transcriptional LysR family regulator
MNIRNLNLNLLLALEALLTEKSVSLAAKKNHITQAAMSNSLNRLRNFFKDPLLVRSGKKMLLTARATELSPKIHKILTELENAINPNIFNPKTSDQKFVLVMPDYTSHLITPKLMNHLNKHAPNIKIIISNIRINDIQHHTTENILAIAPERILPKNLNATKLFTENLVCVAAKNNPILKRRLTVERFLQAEHLQLQIRESHDQKYSMNIYRLLNKRNIKLTTPYISVALYTLERSNMISILPESVATEFREKFSTQPLPFKLPNIVICQAWPKHLDTDVAHMWLRNSIKKIFGETT